MEIKELIKEGLLKVKVYPASGRLAVKGIKDEVLEVYLKSPPLDGKANEELLKFLKREFGLRARIKHGQISREKVVEVI